MNGQSVGQLTKSLGVLTFKYERDWLASSTAVPLSLSIPLSSGEYRGDTIYRFFDNLLPDSTKIRERMQTRLKAESNDAFDLLAEAGADCIGAIQLVKALPAPSVTASPPVGSPPLSAPAAASSPTAVCEFETFKVFKTLKV